MNSDVPDSRRNAFGSMRLNRSFGRLFAPSLFHARHSACPRTVAHGQISDISPMSVMERPGTSAGVTSGGVPRSAAPNWGSSGSVAAPKLTRAGGVAVGPMGIDSGCRRVDEAYAVSRRWCCSDKRERHDWMGIGRMQSRGPRAEVSAVWGYGRQAMEHAAHRSASATDSRPTRIMSSSVPSRATRFPLGETTTDHAPKPAGSWVRVPRTRRGSGGLRHWRPRPPAGRRRPTWRR